MSIDELKHHIEVIRQLDPKPGSRFNPTSSQYVIPDVYVVKVEDRHVAMLNEDGMPQLRISPVYRRLLDNKQENNNETRAYVKEKFRSALWPHQVDRPAPEDHLQGRNEHHLLPDRVPRPRHRVSPSPDIA